MLLAQAPPVTDQITFVDYLPDGKRLLVARAQTNAPSLEIWDAKGRKRLRKIDLEKDIDVSTVAMAPDAKIVALGGPNRSSTHIVDLDSGKTTLNIEAGIFFLPQFTFLPNGKQLLAIRSALLTEYGSLQASLVDAATSKTTDLDGSGGATQIAADPSGHWLAVAVNQYLGSPNIWPRHFQSRVLTYNAATHELAKTITLPDDVATVSLAFTPDGSKLAVRRVDGPITLYRTVDATPVQTLTSPATPGGPMDNMNAMKFSQNAKTLATLSFGSVTLYDLSTTKSKTYNPKPWTLWRGFAFSPDGSSFVIGGTDGKIEFRK